MSQDPEAIRQEIEETRGRMGETVEALAYKTDVPARTRDAVNDRIDTIKGKVSDVIGSASDALGGAAASTRSAATNAAAALPSREQALEGVRSVGSLASANPLVLAVGSVALGFLIGLLLPVTEIERERVGPIGEQMTEQAKAAATGALEQGKAAVKQVIGDALSGATASGADASA